MKNAVSGKRIGAEMMARHEGELVAKITHIAIKVDDIEKTSAFYESVFGFAHVNTVRRKGVKGDHVSRHLTDGTTDLTLISYPSEDADEADLAGPAPVIHHFGIEVEDLAAARDALVAAGAEIVSRPDHLPIKFRAPGGPIAEIVPAKRYTAETLGEGVHGEILA